ncbi:MAG: 7-cyano-7-deazaguanine synthase QueC [Nitrospinae bacterium]|jgi:7-cyano-7-deazaguanine synthase|nr:7-cyano-7-deazaguanine synthase QueC [Nitrospinota bacterium]MDA1110661.1 7-cyano-7-deazaguanine synthase QueC [Nitrospinota bacterium]
MNLKAIILLSGGLDSATTLAIAKTEGFQPFTLSFDYGQRHRVELDRAKEISERMSALQHRVVNIDLKQFGGSALTDAIEVPKNRDDTEMADGIPVTYVPARNTIFLSYALAYAEVQGAKDIFIGVNAVDYSGYPDCRPEFIEAFEKVANLATKAGVEGQSLKIHTPLIDLSKAQIIQKGLALGVDYSLTHSCYDPDDKGLACGVCDSCQLRLRGFKEAGVADPVKYRRG